MKFMITYTIPTAHSRDAIARFLGTGAPPPTGVKMLGRWHAGQSGYLLAESNKAAGIFEWIAQWSDLINFKADPVIEDAEAAKILKRVTKD